MNEHAASCLTEEDLCPYIQIDAELPVEEATFELVNELHALEPYGAGNPRPIFFTRNLRIMDEPRLIGEKHLEMHVAGPG